MSKEYNNMRVQNLLEGLRVAKGDRLVDVIGLEAHLINANPHLALEHAAILAPCTPC